MEPRVDESRVESASPNAVGTLSVYPLRDCTFRLSRAMTTAPYAISPDARLERLPYEVYALRGALDARAQAALARDIGASASGGRSRSSGSVDWLERARANNHPTIIAAYGGGGGERSVRCVRACGLTRCVGACGREVGALVEEPREALTLARDVAREISRRAGRDGGGGMVDGLFDGDEPYEPSHFWALVYGGVSGQSKMSTHLDRPVGWTLSVSVGRAARMTIGRAPEAGEQYDKLGKDRAIDGQREVEVEIRSGDCLLFRGDRVFHSVDGLGAERGAPLEWAQALTQDSAVDGYVPGRMALLFREERETQGKLIR